jgi:hypothetical protein
MLTTFSNIGITDIENIQMNSTYFLIFSVLGNTELSWICNRTPDPDPWTKLQYIQNTDLWYCALV